ncbi:MAG: hypothetical protein ACRDGK_01805 [Actinomycetota bacterium]
MPDVREVYEMVTKQKPPQPGALERQQTRQARSARNKKLGAFAIAAAIGVAALVLILVNRPGGETSAPATVPPAVNPAEPGSEPVGTVTFDGSTCSIEITADRIEPGVVLFEVVNVTEKSAMFDSWRLLEGYTVRAFEARIERDRRLAERPGNQGTFPGEKQVNFLSSDIIPANDSGIIVPTMFSGRHAIVCLRPFEGDFRPFGVVGPIIVP